MLSYPSENIKMHSNCIFKDTSKESINLCLVKVLKPCFRELMANISMSELALHHTEWPTNMATNSKFQNQEQPTNLAAEDDNIQQPSRTLSRSSSPYY